MSELEAQQMSVMGSPNGQMQWLTGPAGQWALPI